MRDVIYCRVSTKEQLQNLSLDTQQKTCTEFCSRQGWTVDRVFVEKGESAKTADRTELKNLLTHCREHRGRIHCVVVYAVNRFARDQYDHSVLRLQLQRLGVTLRSATEPIDDSSTGKLMEGIVAAFAQFDNDVRSERTVQGMKARLERGGWTFPAPLGYLAQRDSNGKKTLLPDPERAPFVTHAFELFASGLYNVNETLAIVGKMGLRTRAGKTLTPQSFGALLRKPVYAGQMVIPKWNIHCAGDFPSLVNPETFSRVQAILAGRHPSVSARLRSNPDFPLRHFVQCGKCLRALTASWSRGRSKRYAYYRCQNRVCRGVNSRREEVERKFVDFLEQLKPKPEYLRLFGEIIVDVWKKKQAKVVTVHDVLLRRLADLKKRKHLLLEAFVYKRALDQPTYQEEVDRLNEEITLAEMEADDARLDQLDIEAAVEFAQYVLLNAGRMWSESGAEQKQRLQKLIFPSSVQFEEGVYRTATTSMIFFELEDKPAYNERLVALPGIEPGFED